MHLLTSGIRAQKKIVLFLQSKFSWASSTGILALESRKLSFLPLSLYTELVATCGKNNNLTETKAGLIYSSVLLELYHKMHTNYVIAITMWPLIYDLPLQKEQRLSSTR